MLSCTLYAHLASPPPYIQVSPIRQLTFCAPPCHFVPRHSSPAIRELNADFISRSVGDARGYALGEHSPEIRESILGGWYSFSSKLVKLLLFLLQLSLPTLSTPILFCFVRLIYHSLNAHLIRLIWLNLQTSKHITFSFFPPPSNIILRSFVFVSNLYCKRRSICNCYLCVQWKMVTCQSSLYLFGWRIKLKDCADSLGE